MTREPVVIWRGAEESAAGFAFLLIGPEWTLPTRTPSGLIHELGVPLRTHDLTSGTIAQAGRHLTDPVVEHRWVSPEAARSLLAADPSLVLLDEASEWIRTHTWDGSPIAQDWPKGATVVVWRRKAGSGIEVLLLHRAHHGPDYAGDWAWTPPAGARHPGEDVDACAARELYEEAGLVLEATRLDDGESWARFVASAPDDAVVTLHDDEHDRFIWVEPDEAFELVAPVIVRDTLRSALEWVRADAEVPVFDVSVPGYVLGPTLDARAIGRELDDFIAGHIDQRRVAIRGISSTDHPGRSLDELVDLIQRHGTDRYDPDRVSVLHEVYGPHGVELHALPCTIDGGLRSAHCPGRSVMADVIEDFVQGPPVDRGGPPLRLDLLLIYDLDRLRGVQVPGEPDPAAPPGEPEPCAYRFADPTDRAGALVALIRLLP